MSDEMMFRGRVCKNNKTLLLYIPNSANTIDLDEDDEVVVWVRKFHRGGVHANEQV